MHYAGILKIIIFCNMVDSALLDKFAHLLYSFRSGQIYNFFVILAKFTKKI
jgi:hypothetical protein